MKSLAYFLTVVLAATLITGCTDFAELEKDPNRAVTAPPSLIFRGIQTDMYFAPWGDEQRYNQFWCSNYNYYDDNEYNWTGANLRFTTLKNVLKMEEEALTSGADAVNPYSALGKFFRAYAYYDMTSRVGDLPLEQALSGDENIAPAYSSQKAIFAQVLTWLDEANSEFTTLIANIDLTLGGDIYFGNDLSKWQKVNNALRMRVLIALSKRADESDLGVQAKMAEMVANPTKYPMMESNADNMAYTFNSNLNKYPFNPDNFGFYALRYNTSATYVNTLADLRDPRVFVVAEPATAKLAGGLTAADYEAYVGAPSDEGLDDMSTKVQNGEYSLINKERYFSSYEGERSIQIGYPEMCFNIAEAINRGWAAGDAADWYKKGITASMAFYGITDAIALNTYLAQEKVAYKGGVEGLTQILTQKYLAFHQHSGLEAYYNWRRTGVPAFAQGGPGTGNGGVIPSRFQYPTSERDNNSANYKAALISQFGSEVDDNTAKMWLIK
ncbi:MAG: SusD/RagB family nutrient-binding outer membrane lipoprotein [Bacteroidia bacterium]|nr:SusD/RagB family nutrient-binding outer membrane lipoprotein [Bacteroidia bacterium]